MFYISNLTFFVLYHTCNGHTIPKTDWTSNHLIQQWLSFKSSISLDSFHKVTLEDVKIMRHQSKTHVALKLQRQFRIHYFLHKRNCRRTQREAFYNNYMSQTVLYSSKTHWCSDHVVTAESRATKCFITWHRREPNVAFRVGETGVMSITLSDQTEQLKVTLIRVKKICGSSSNLHLTQNLDVTSSVGLTRYTETR